MQLRVLSYPPDFSSEQPDQTALPYENRLRLPDSFYQTNTRQEVTKILKPFHIRKKIAYFAEKLQLKNKKYNESTFRPS